MKITRVQRKGSEGTDSGFKDSDQHAIDRANDHMPKTQVFSSRNDNIEESLCADCGSRLAYFSNIQKYYCTYVRCGKVIDAVANTPLTNTNQGMQPFQSQHFDPNNPEGEPFFVSFSPDRDSTTSQKDYEVTYDNGRVKKIKCKGFPSDISINAFND